MLVLTGEICLYRRKAASGQQQRSEQLTQDLLSQAPHMAEAFGSFGPVQNRSSPGVGAVL